MGKFAADDFAAIGRRLAELEGRAGTDAAGHQWEAGGVSGSVGAPPVRFAIPVLMPKWEPWDHSLAPPYKWTMAQEMNLCFRDGRTEIHRFGGMLVADPNLVKFHPILWQTWKPPSGPMQSPVDPFTRVAVKFRAGSGTATVIDQANAYHWNNSGSPSDIVSFAVVLEP